MELSADNYSGRPQEWAQNQLAHFALGLLAFAAICLATFFLIGEYPSKWKVWVFIAVCYAVWELWIQPRLYGGFLIFDSIEDWFFVCLYGAGFSAIVFSEIEPGSLRLEVNAAEFLPLIAILATHLVAGIFVRIWQSRGNG